MDRGLPHLGTLHAVLGFIVLLLTAATALGGTLAFGKTGLLHLVPEQHRATVKAVHRKVGPSQRPHCCVCALHIIRLARAKQVELANFFIFSNACHISPAELWELQCKWTYCHCRLVQQCLSVHVQSWSWASVRDKSTWYVQAPVLQLMQYGTGLYTTDSLLGSCRCYH